MKQRGHAQESIDRLTWRMAARVEFSNVGADKRVISKGLIGLPKVISEMCEKYKGKLAKMTPKQDYEWCDVTLASV